MGKHPVQLHTLVFPPNALSVDCQGPHFELHYGHPPPDPPNPHPKHTLIKLDLPPLLHPVKGHALIGLQTLVFLLPRAARGLDLNYLPEECGKTLFSCTHWYSTQVHYSSPVKGFSLNHIKDPPPPPQKKKKHTHTLNKLAPHPLPQHTNPRPQPDYTKDWGIHLRILLKLNCKHCYHPCTYPSLTVSRGAQRFTADVSLQDIFQHTVMKFYWCNILLPQQYTFRTGFQCNTCLHLYLTDHHHSKFLTSKCILIIPHRNHWRK